MTSFGISSSQGWTRDHARRATLLTAASAAALTAAAAAPAHAQTELAPIDVIGEAETYRAEELDSPKFPKSIQETPKSVTVITEEVLQDTAAASLTEALRTVPGITMAMGEGGQPFADRPFLRGYESTSGLLVDGLRDTGSQNRDTFNLESITVAKGAGGAYGGRGGAGGTIDLGTKAPRAEDFVNLTGRVGDPSYVRSVLDANQMLSETIGVRAVMMFQEADVPGRDEVFDDRWGFAPSITFGLNRPTQVTASYYHFESDGLADYGHPLEPNTGQAQRGPQPGLEQENFYGLVNRDHQINEVDSGTFEVSHEFENGFRLRNITRYAETLNDYIATNPDDSQGNVQNGLVARNVKSRYEENETFVNQTDLAGTFNTGRLVHNISTGFEFSDEETVADAYSVDTTTAADGTTIGRGDCDLYGAGEPSGYNCTDLYSPSPNDPWSGVTPLRGSATTTEVDTAAVYLFDTIDFSPRWSVNLGVRWDDYSTETSSGLSNESDFFSYQAGLVFNPTDSASLYASASSSSSPSGVTAGAGGQNLGASNEDLKPEKNYTYEVGAKWGLFDDRLLATVAVFRNEQQDGHVAVAAGRGAPQQAIGESRVDGIELSASGQITDRWSIFAGYSYLDSEIIDDGPIGTDEGNRMPNTPEHSFTLWTTYQVTPDFALGGGARYQDERFGNTANSTYVEDYWVVDAFAEYQVTDRFGLQLNVNNLLDEFYYDRVYTTHMATVGQGRQILLSGLFEF